MAERGASTTVIVNSTGKPLHVKVGNHRCFVDFAHLPRGGAHSMHVDYNDTYREFLVGVDDLGEGLVVTSDDCCDYECITVTEVDGRLDIVKVPRRRMDENRRATSKLKGRGRGMRRALVPVHNRKLVSWGRRLVMCRSVDVVSMSLGRHRPGLVG